MNDGTVLLNLLEIIGKDSILSVCGRKFSPAAKCKMDIHKLENCNLIFEYLKARELKIVNIGSSDIKDGSPRLVLGLLWTIILRFAIDEDGKEGLLLWCRKNTKDFRSVDVQNFSRSWQDGLAFCSLIAKFRPDLLNYDDMLAKKDDPMFIMNAAFEAAEKAGIAKLLDAEDIVGSAKPDDKSIVAYLSIWFKQFAALAQKDALAEAIKKAIATTKHHDALAKTYASDSRSLLSWTHVQDQKFLADAELAVSSTAEVKALIEASHVFKNEAKPTKQQLLASSEALLAALRLSQRNNERTMHAPKIEIDDLETEWATLLKSEQEFDTAAISLLADFERTDYALQRFAGMISKVEDFVATNSPVFASSEGEDDEDSSKASSSETFLGSALLGVSVENVKETVKKMLNNSFFGTSVETCHVLVKKCANFSNQTPRYSAMMASCEDFLAMCHAKHAGTAAAKEQFSKAEDSLAELVADAAAFKANVEEKLAEEKRLLALVESYDADLANFEFEFWELAQALKENVSMYNTVEAVGKVIERTDEAKVSLEAAEVTLANIESVHAELEAANYPIERKTALKEARQQFDLLNASLDGRFASLQAALTTQKEKAAVKEEFAASTEKLMTFCAETARLVASLTRRLTIAPELAAEKLTGVRDTFGVEGPVNLSEVEAAHAAQVSSEILVNGLTTHTVFGCRLVYAECEKHLKDAIDVNAAHILAQTAGAALSAEQAQEIREAFDTFDQNKSGNLTLKDFCEGLQGMGLVLSNDDAAAEFRKRDLDNTGKLSFDGFASFILEQFQAGSTEADIQQAFSGLCDGSGTMNEDTMGQWFGADEECVEYMNAGMEGGEYKKFVTELFKN